MLYENIANLYRNPNQDPFTEVVLRKWFEGFRLATDGRAEMNSLKPEILQIMITLTSFALHSDDGFIKQFFNNPTKFLITKEFYCPFMITDKSALDIKLELARKGG